MAARSRRRKIYHLYSLVLFVSLASTGFAGAATVADPGPGNVIGLQGADETATNLVHGTDGRNEAGHHSAVDAPNTPTPENPSNTVPENQPNVPRFPMNPTTAPENGFSGFLPADASPVAKAVLNTLDKTLANPGKVLAELLGGGEAADIANQTETSPANNLNSGNV